MRPIFHKENLNITHKAGDKLVNMKDFYYICNSKSEIGEFFLLP